MPPAPPTITLQITDLRDHFDAGSLARGLQYARASGRVRVVSLDNDGTVGRLFISGTVRGSSKHPYATEVLVNYDAASGTAFHVSGECSCPVEFDCKHAVALLVTALSDALSEPPPPLPVTPAAPVSRDLKPTPATLTWLAALDAPVDAADDVLSGEFRVVYLLDPTQGTLSVAKSRCLKRGGLGKPAAWIPYGQDLGQTGRSDIQDTDIPVLRLATACQTGSNYYARELIASLRGETGFLLLQHALRTGRVFVDGDMERPLQSGAAIPVSLAWQRDRHDQQRIGFDLPAGLLSLPTWPVLYFDATGSCIGELDFGLPEKLARQLVTAPPLNEADALVVRQRLGSIEKTQGIALPLPEAAGPELTGPPVPRLHLRLGRLRHHSMSSMTDDVALAELDFDYPGLPPVAGVETPPPLMHLEVGGEVRAIARDLQTEAAVWQQLIDEGLDSQQHRLPNYLRIDSLHDALLPLQQNATGWLPILTEGIPALETAGVVVTIADDFPFRIASSDDWYVEVEEERGGDWFNLDLGVMIGTERISLVPPLVRLIAAQPGLLTRLSTMRDDEHLPVAIDDQRILPLPVPRLRAWLLPLLEFLDHSPHGDRPRLSRYHAATLATLDEQPAHWLGGEQLRSIGAKLKDFSGITAVPPASTFRTTLRHYQQEGLNWLQFLREYRLAGILADDMGLGKTVQTLAHLQIEKHSGRADLPSLVIAPTSLMANWKNEAAQFAPDLTVLTLHGPDRAALFDGIATADIVLTTYPLLVRDQAVLLTQAFHVLVLDEAQFIKNPKAKAHHVARQLVARHRLSLTGTPLENHLGELWAQFDFLMPGFLGNAPRFNRTFRTPIEKLGDSTMRQTLSERVRPFLLRRTKEQVLTELPPRTEIVRWVEIEGGQRDIYESLRVAFDKKLRQVLREKGVGQSQIMILDALLKLRQVCCDPRLVKLDSARAIVKKGHAESAKLTLLMEMVEELLDEGRKILLFSQFTSMISLIEDELKQRSIDYTKLTGQTKDRETAINRFQSGAVPLFLISLKAGGTGLNLTAADTVIHYDPWWNPAVEEQATARAHRMGQDKPVFVYKLMTQGTVEEKILALQSRKRGLADQLIKGDAAGKHLLSAEDLDVLFQPLG